MSVGSFRSVFMVASCAGAALGCYLVSLRVASERAALEQVEQEIVLAQRDIRVLQTEIGTRGRLAQLERWNVKVLALSAPSADQFVNGGFELARMVAPQRKVDIEAPVVLASGDANAARPVVQGAPGQTSPDADQGVSARELMQVASLKSGPVRPSAAKPAPSNAASTKPSSSKPAPTKAAGADATKPRPASSTVAAKTPATKTSASVATKTASTATRTTASTRPVTKAAASPRPAPAAAPTQAEPEPADGAAEASTTAQ